MGSAAIINGSQIVVRTRDHCDTHVHAIHMAEGWELKIYFSYVDTVVKPQLPAKKGKPKNSQIQQCMNIVTDELDKCRRLFWLAMQCVCLDNQYVKLMDGEIHVAKANTTGAKKSPKRQIQRSK
jgi:hypothetical protein